MSFPPEHLGSFRYFGDDGAQRDIHVWAAYDPVMGEIVCIYFGISTLLSCATGPVKVHECKTRLQKAALAFARRECEDVELIEDVQRSGEVIRLDDHR